MTTLITATVLFFTAVFAAQFVKHSMASICRRHRDMVKAAMVNQVQVLDEAISELDAELEVIEAVETVIDYSIMKTPQLRKACTAAGIEWRNVRGKGKHLLNADMKAALMAIA